MAASPIVTVSSSRVGRWRWAYLLLVLVGGLVGTSWWLTEPLEDPGAPPERTERTAARPVAATPDPEPPAAWPEGTLEGTPAKALLLSVLLEVQSRFDQVDGYTATFRKQERLRGTLGPEQTLAMKVRQRPFAVYFKFLAPQAGKEVVYAEGHHGNKVIAHATGAARWLVPRLAVAPDSPLALADSRHAVTESGLGNLLEKLVSFRRLDLEDSDAVTVLDRTTDGSGRPWLRSVHLHTERTQARPFVRVEVLYDPETRFPLRISSYDWPEPGHEGDLHLAERYCYDDLDVNAVLSAVDFDPANPEYAFHRY